MANLSGVAPTPIGTDKGGNPIYRVLVRQGFYLVVEAKKGAGRRSVGTTVFNWAEDDPSVRPDLQIQPARPLGNGSGAVCDRGPVPAPVGGVPAITPPSFAGTQLVADVLNDLGCRFNVRSSSGEACTGSGGSFFFLGSGTDEQFCALVGTEFSFPSGDTLLTVRVLDTIGQPGLPKSFVIRAP